jgi:hypothetical protein
MALLTNGAAKRFVCDAIAAKASLSRIEVPR